LSQGSKKTNGGENSEGLKPRFKGISFLFWGKNTVGGTSPAFFKTFFKKSLGKLEGKNFLGGKKRVFFLWRGTKERGLQVSFFWLISGKP